MIVGSLFSGIGGLEHGLGYPVAWHVEQSKFCRRILAKHWPDAASFDDVREVGARNLAPVDVLCGGFPCQDISVAGLGAGLAGAKSGLWFEMLRIITEMRPRYVVAENVAALKGRGLDVVLAGLYDAGYLTAWSIVGASDVGAPHRRKRLWIVASRRDCPMAFAPSAVGSASQWARSADNPEPWELGVSRVTDIRENRRHRLHALGNAVVPQCAALIRERIDAAGTFSLSLSGGASRAAEAYPTPTAVMRDNRSIGAEHSRPCLETLAKTWPTPVAQDFDGARASDFGRNSIPLRAAVMYPTPVAHNAKGAPGSGSVQSGGRQSDLCAAVMYPTPTAHDGNGAPNPGDFRRNTVPLKAHFGTQLLNPDWVELLMGYPQGWTA